MLNWDTTLAHLFLKKHSEMYPIAKVFIFVSQGIDHWSFSSVILRFQLFLINQKCHDYFICDVMFIDH